MLRWPRHCYRRWVPTPLVLPAKAPVMGHSQARASGWTTAILLLVGGAGVGLAAAIGVVRPDVPGTIGGATVAAWVAVLPAVIAVLLTAVRPLAGLALGAGIGITGVARLAADLFVLLQPESVARPELFYPVSGRAYPIGVAPGGLVLVAADAVTVIAGVLSARALSGVVDDLGDRFVIGRVAGEISGGSLPDDPGAGAGGGGAGGRGDGVASGAVDGRAGGPAARNVPMLVAGFMAVAFVGFGAAQLPYSGGFIEQRLSVPGTDFGSLIAPFLIAVVIVGAVILAGARPRTLASSMLGGVAVAAAVPALTAIVVGATDAPVVLSWTVYAVLLGCVVLLLAGLLSTVRWSAGAAWSTSRAGSAETGAAADAAADAGPGDTAADYRSVADEPADSGPPARWASTLGLLAAGAFLAAWSLPVVLLNGHREALGTNGYRTDDRVSASLLLVGILLAVSAVASMVRRPAVARSGRAAQLVGWSSAVWVLALPIDLLESLGSQVGEAQNFADAGILDPASVSHWTIGPGLWLAIAGALLAAAAAVAAGIALGRAEDEDTTVTDDESAERSRRWRWVVAGILLVFSTAVLAMPIYRIVGAGSAVSSSSVFGGAGDVWGVWALLAGIAVAVVAGARTRYGEVAAGAVLAAAAVMAIRLVFPRGLAGDPGFRPEAGRITGWIGVAMLLAGSAVMLVLARRVPLMQPPRPVKASAPVTAGPVASAAPTTRSAAGKRGPRRPGGSRTAGRRR